MAKFNRRNIDGVLLLDKPTGITANDAVQKVKYIYYAQKVGHTGSLDPLATGMLPLCFGKATKLSQFLLEADKYYRVIGKLGIKTTTQDAEGEIVEEKTARHITENDVEKVLAKFRGKISQIPSMYSAIKHQGQPLYKLARQGITVERKAREVEIYQLELLSFADDKIELKVKCSKGTYIRTLIEDIGDALAVGAHVIALRRLAVGSFAENDMINLQALEELKANKKWAELDALVLPAEVMVQYMQKVEVSEAAAFYLRQGQAVILPYAPVSGWVRLVLGGERLLGVGEILPDGKVAPRRLLV